MTAPLPQFQKRPHLLVTATALLLALVSTACQSTTPSPPLAWSDLHNSTLYQAHQSGDLENHLRKFKHDALNGPVRPKFLLLSIGLPRFSSGLTPTTTSYHDLTAIYRQARTALAPEFFIPTSRNDLAAGLATGRVPYCFGLEGSRLIAEGWQPKIRQLHHLGVRKITLAHWFSNPLFTTQDGLPLGSDTRLSHQGRQLLEAMIKNKMIIDVSHMPENLFADVEKLTRDRAPIVASHSNASAIHPHRRNLTDPQIKTIASSGGLVGICFHTPYLGPRTAAPLHHLQHIRSLAGPEHIAIGSDWGGGTTPPPDLSTPRDLPAFSTTLRKHGIPQAEIDAIFADNVTRFVSLQCLE